MSKKIALCLEKFSRFAGGAESYALSLADSFIAKGWDVHLYGESWDGSPKEAHFHEISVPRFLPSWLRMLVFALKHKQMVKKENFDVVMGFGNTIAMNVYQSHGGVHRYSTSRKAFSIRNPLLRFIKRFLILISIKDKVRNWIESAPFRLKPAPKVIAISQMVVDDFATYFKNWAGDVALIYNGIDLGKFNPGLREKYKGEVRKELHIASDQVMFLFLSYTLRKKGIFPFIESAALLNSKHHGKFKIVVVGKMPQQSILKMIHKHGLEDVFCFCGPTKEPEKYFADTDVFVLPTYYDTCSLVTIESMACGVPVITTEYNGAAGIIDSGDDGHVISHPPAACELAEAMEAYLDKEKLQIMADKAAHKALNYSISANHEAVIRVCEDAAHNDGGV